MKTLLLALSVCSLSACALDQLDDATDDSTQTGTDDQSIIGGTTDTGDACVVGVFAHAAGSAARVRLPAARPSLVASRLGLGGT